MSDTVALLARLDDRVAAMDPAGVAALCIDIGAKSLLTVRPEISEWFENSFHGNRDADETYETSVLKRSAAALAVLASSRTIHQAASALDSAGVAMDLNIVVPLLESLRPRWLPTFANRLTKNVWQNHWRLGRALVVAGLCEKPSDPRYLEQMAGGIGHIAVTLREDSALIDDVWRVLHGEGPGTLGSAPSLTPDLQRTWMPEVPPEDRYWSSALVALTDEGLLDRGELIDAALAALQRHTTWLKLRWYIALLDELQLSDDERASRTTMFASLLRSPLSPVVAYGQRVCRALLDRDDLRPDDFLAYADSPFFLSTKNVAFEQISLLVAVGANSAWRDEAAVRLGTALGHERNDVQSAAMDAVEAWWHQLSESTRQELSDFSEASSPSSLARWRSLTEHSPGQSADTPTASGWTPPIRKEMPDPLDDDHLVLGLAAMIERTATPMLVERVIEAALRVAGMPLHERQRLIEPIAARARGIQMPYGTLDGWALKCVHTLMGDAQNPPGSWRPTVGGDLLGEILMSIEAGVSRPYAAMPHQSDGRIDSKAAQQRLAAAPGAGPAEQLVCQLRSDANHHLLEIAEVSWEPAADVFVATAVIDLHADVHIDISHHRWQHSDSEGQPTGEIVLGAPKAPIERSRQRQLELISYLAGNPFSNGTEAAWPLTLTPHHLDLPMIAGGVFLAEGMDNEPSTIGGSSLTEILRRLVDPSQHPGVLAPLIVAMGLGAKPVHTRLAGVEAQLSVSSTKRVPDAEIAAAVARLAVAKRIKLARVARSLNDVMDLDPTLARDQAMSILTSSTAERDAHALATVLCDAVQLAGPIDVPDHLAELANMKGRTKLQVELRQLLATIGRPRTPRGSWASGG